MTRVEAILFGKWDIYVRFSKREYGTRAMIELAARHGSQPIGVKTIAERQAIPEKYLEQIMGPLRRANLVTSVRGSQGGYKLARPPGQINLGEILTALGGPFSFSGCEARSNGCPRSSLCPTREVYQKLVRTMNDELGAVTLADLVRRQREMEGEQAFAFFI